MSVGTHISPHMPLLINELMNHISGLPCLRACVTMSFELKAEFKPYASILYPIALRLMAANDKEYLKVLLKLICFTLIYQHTSIDMFLEQAQNVIMISPNSKRTKVILNCISMLTQQINIETYTSRIAQICSNFFSIWFSLETLIQVMLNKQRISMALLFLISMRRRNIKECDSLSWWDWFCQEPQTSSLHWSFNADHLFIEGHQCQCIQEVLWPFIQQLKEVDRWSLHAPRHALAVDISAILLKHNQPKRAVQERNIPNYFLKLLEASNEERARSILEQSFTSSRSSINAECPSRLMITSLLKLQRVLRFFSTSCKDTWEIISQTRNRLKPCSHSAQGWGFKTQRMVSSLW